MNLLKRIFQRKTQPSAQYRVYLNACGCELCEGIPAPKPPRGWVRQTTGGREPAEIQYNPRKVVLVWTTATGRMWSVNTPPDLTQNLDAYKSIATIPSSVHGCWKVRKNQELHILAIQ